MKFFIPSTKHRLVVSLFSYWDFALALLSPPCLCFSGGPNPRWARTTPWASFFSLCVRPSSRVSLPTGLVAGLFIRASDTVGSNPTCRAREILEEGVAWPVACPVAWVRPSSNSNFACVDLSRASKYNRTTWWCIVVQSAQWYLLEKRSKTRESFGCSRWPYQEPDLTARMGEKEQEASTPAFFFILIYTCFLV